LPFSVIRFLLKKSIRPTYIVLNAAAIEFIFLAESTLLNGVYRRYSKKLELAALVSAVLFLSIRTALACSSAIFDRESHILLSAFALVVVLQQLCLVLGYVTILWNASKGRSEDAQTRLRLTFHLYNDDYESLRVLCRLMLLVLLVCLLFALLTFHLQDLDTYFTTCQVACLACNRLKNTRRMMTGGMASIDTVNKAQDGVCQDEYPLKGMADVKGSHRKDSIITHSDAVGSDV